MSSINDFNPYSFNGGTILAIAGPTFAMIAADTRLSEGYMIHSRNCSKVYKLTHQTFISCAGFHGDILTVTNILKGHLSMYRHEHKQEMSTSAIASLLSRTLYYKRFFPYYIHVIIAGLDEHGVGCVYSFDSIGSHERVSYKAAGSAGAILQPMLDNVRSNDIDMPYNDDKTYDLIKDLFTSAAERDVYTGDEVEINVIRSGEDTLSSTHILRKD